MLLNCRLVRDYLELEFKNAELLFAFDVERVVDDFVLFCMLIGNDFLPCEHLAPSCLAVLAAFALLETPSAARKLQSLKTPVTFQQIRPSNCQGRSGAY